jgi:hypothetical protein
MMLSELVPRMGFSSHRLILLEFSSTSSGFIQLPIGDRRSIETIVIICKDLDG